MSSIKTTDILIRNKNKLYLQVNYKLDDVVKIKEVGIIINGTLYLSNYFTLNYSVFDLSFLKDKNTYDCQVCIKYITEEETTINVTYNVLTEDEYNVITESNSCNVVTEDYIEHSTNDNNIIIYEFKSNIFAITTKFLIQQQSVIKIYEYDEADFDNNGLGILLPKSAIITRELNDYKYYLDLIHPFDKYNKWKLLQEDRIIKANNQLFRIKHVIKTLSDITVYAEHIFFDLQNNFIEDTNIVEKNGRVAIDQILTNTSYSHPFTGTSNITTISSSRMVRKNVVSALIGSDENSFINRWGGEIDMDWLSFNIDGRIGQDRGYKITYGKNLTGLNAKFDMTNVVTRIRPVGFDGIALSSTNRYVDSPLIDNYAMPIIREYTYKNVKWVGSPNYSSNNMISNNDFSKKLDAKNDWKRINSNNTSAWQSTTSGNSYMKLTTSSSISIGVAQTIKTNADKYYFVKCKMTLDTGAFGSIRITQGKNIRYFQTDKYYDSENQILSFSFQSVLDGDTELFIYANNKYGVEGTSIRVYNIYMYEKADANKEEFVYDTLKEAQDKLRELAELEYTENQIDIPTTTYDINFQELSKTEEYKDYLALTLINIGDDVAITHKKLGIDIPARCIEYKYDCLLQKYESITLGHYNVNFFTETSQNNSELSGGFLETIPKQLNDFLQQAKDEASNLVKNGFGGHVWVTENAIYIMDTDDINTAQKIWVWNENGLGYSSTGIDGEFELAMTQDGSIVADFITTGVMSADRVRTGNIISADGTVNIDLDNNYLRIQTTENENATIIDSSGMEIQSENQTLATFREKSYIPFLYADDIECSNLARKHPYAEVYYVNGHEGSGSDLNNGLTTATQFSTIQRAIDTLPDLLEHDVIIHVNNSSPGFYCRNKLGGGLVTICIHDGATINGDSYIYGCNGIRFIYQGYYGTEGGRGYRKGSFLGTVNVYETRQVEFVGILFDGNKQANCINSERNTKVVIENCGFKNATNACINNRHSSVYLRNNIGDSIPYVVYNQGFTELYLAGSTVPNYTSSLYEDASTSTTWTFEQSTYTENKTSLTSSDVTPTYIVSSKRQRWNCYNYVGHETLTWKYDNAGVIRQGYVASWNTGRWWSEIGFDYNNIKNIISGATNYSGRLYVKRSNTSHGQSTGSKIALYAQDGTAIDTTTTFSRGEGKWITIPGAIIQKIANGTCKYFYCKWDSNDSSRYIIFDPVFKLEISYTK